MARHPKDSGAKKKTRKIRNSVCDIPAVVENPKRAVATATVRKKTDQDTIWTSALSLYAAYYSLTMADYQFWKFLQI
jgi:hypothetical protein